MSIKYFKSITLNNEYIELLNELLSMNEYEFYKEDQIKKSKLCKDLLDYINRSVKQ